MISGKAKLAGVMGWPVGHSLSPRIHNYWLQQHRIDGAYVPLVVEPVRFEQALRALSALGFQGVNLTVPHKETALFVVDRLDNLAQRVGAVNTVVVRKDGSLEGRNTDVFGFAENLRNAGLTTGDIATIIGAGGAARAVIVALQEMGFTNIRVVNRTRERAEKLSKSFSDGIQIFDEAKINEALDGADLLVNTTSLGMVGEPPLKIDLLSLPREAWVTDVVYAPLMTDLLKQAQQRGNKIVDGLNMLLHQASPGFEAWFGAKPEVNENLRRFVLAET